VPAYKISQQTKLSYPTSLKAMDIKGFWSYAKQRFIKFHGVSKEKFPLYLKEMEFRYNHRNQDLFILLAKNICDFVPELL